MAAGSTTHILTDYNGGVVQDYWELQSNGATDVVVYPKVAWVINVQVCWGEDIGTTAQTLDVTVLNRDASTGSALTGHYPSVAVAASGSMDDKKVYVTVVGYP